MNNKINNNIPENEYEMRVEFLKDVGVIYRKNNLNTCGIETNEPEIRAILNKAHSSVEQEKIKMNLYNEFIDKYEEEEGRQIDEQKYILKKRRANRKWAEAREQERLEMICCAEKLKKKC